MESPAGQGIGRASRKLRLAQAANSECLCKLALEGNFNHFRDFLNSLDMKERKRAIVVPFNHTLPIHFAVRGGNVDIVKLLILVGGEGQVHDSKTLVSGETALHVAASRGSLTVVKALMDDAGADPLKKDSSGYTSFDKSRQGGHFDLTEKMYGWGNFIECRLGCHAIMPVKDLAFHETSECPRAVVACPACHVLMSVQDFHDQHECGKELIECKLCNKHVPAEEMAEHDMQCSATTTRPCPKCTLPIPIKDLVCHKLDECPEREVRCNACEEWIRAKNRPNHLLYECAMRLVDCEMCGVNMPVREYQNHVENVCPDRTVSCRFGCNVKAKHKCSHEESHLAKDFRRWTHQELLWWLELSYFDKRAEVSVVHRARIFHLFETKRIGGKHLCKLWRDKLMVLLRKLLKRDETSSFIRHLGIIKTSCPRDCGEILYLRDMVDHKDFCSKRMVRCLRCGLSVVAETLLAHRSECVGSERRRKQGMRRRGPSSSLPILPRIPGDIDEEKRVKAKLKYEKMKRRGPPPI